MKTTPMFSFRLSRRAHLVALLLWTWLAAPLISQATVRFWTGGGANNNWNNGANWSTGVAPVANDDLIFQGGASVDVTSLNNTNNYTAGTVFNSITITGTNYVLRGNQVVFTNSGVAISAQHVTGANNIEFPIQLGVTTQTFECTGAGAFLNLGSLSLQATIDLNGQNLTFNPTGVINVYDDLTGTGNLTKNGAGSLLLAAIVANTYVGTCSVNAGTLELNDIAGPSVNMITGNLNINNNSIVEVIEGNQIADTATVAMNAAGQFNLIGGVNETIGALTIVNGGDVNTGAGTLAVNGNILGDANTGNPATISGNLSLGAADRIITATDASGASPGFVISANLSGGAGVGFTKTGAGGLRLSGVNTYSGATIVSNGFVNLANNSALGNGGAGTTLRGGSLLMEGVTISNEWLTNDSSSSVVQALGALTSTWASNVVLNATLDIHTFTTGVLDIIGVIQGPGGVTKAGPGTLRYSGGTGVGNTYSGATVVNEGLLELNKLGNLAIASGSLTVGDGLGGDDADIVRYTGGSGSEIHISVPITVTASGLLDLNGHNDDLGGIALLGGTVTTGAGRLIMGGNLTSGNPATNGNASISGILDLGSSDRTFTTTNTLDITANVIGSAAGFVKAGTGNLHLFASNSYAGLTLVQRGFLYARNDNSLGSAAAGTVVSNQATLVLQGGIGVTNESLTLSGTSANSNWGALDVEGSGTNFWNGPIILNAQTSIAPFGSSSVLRINGPISGPGGFVVGSPDGSGSGYLYLDGANANTFAGAVVVNPSCDLLLNKSGFDGAIPQDLTINGTVRALANNQIDNNNSAVVINALGTYDLNGFVEAIGSLAGSGSFIDVGAIFHAGSDNTSTLFSGVISGTGELQKDGAGTMTLTGTNTYTGRTLINSGTLIVNGYQPQSPVTVGGAASLGGTGTVGIVVCSGNLLPGTSPGILTASNLTFTASGDYHVELTGLLPGMDNDQMNVRGTNSLANAVLHVMPAFVTPVALSNQFTILNNDGAEAVTGTFLGLANNATFTTAGYGFRINYGNDVQLTLVDLPGASTGTAVSAGNGDGVIAPNECNHLSIVVTNKTASPMTGVSASLASLTAGVWITQPVSPYPDLPANGRGTNQAGFQISTTTNFVCGSDITLELTVFTATHGAFKLPITIPTGVPAAVPVRYDVNTSTNIPDIGTIDSTNTVAGFVGPVKKVAVSLWLTHGVASDLSLTLISPDGVAIDLSSGNGAGANFGSSCSPDGNRTTFDDTAATAITAGTPPFAGSFRPEGSLAALIGGTANGQWRLRVNDANGGTLGTLRCWSLFLYGADCGIGSGQCELCPEVSISAAFTPSSPLCNSYVQTAGGPSTCGAVKVCPGNIPGLFPCDVFTFRNGPSNACITITVDNSDTGFSMAVSAHSAGFNPAAADKCLSYLGDAGLVVSDINSPVAFEINVAANAVFSVFTVGGGYGPYHLTVTGGNCRPVLNVTPLPGNRAWLDWTTAAGGYQLESTNALITGGTSIWPPVTNAPVVLNGRFNVTNNVTTSNRFYHLRKPLP